MQTALAAEEAKGSSYRWNGEAEHDGQGWNALGIILRPARASARQRRIKATRLLACLATTLETEDCVFFHATAAPFCLAVMAECFP